MEENKEEDLLNEDWVIRSSDIRVLSGEDNVLGRGSYGEVRIAEWRGLKVAAKQLHAFSLSSDQANDAFAEKAKENFLQEMKLLAQLRHPNLVLFLGVALNSQGSLLAVTELLPHSLYDLLEGRGRPPGGALTFPEVLDLAGDVAAGLAYLHGRDPAVVHRDLSAKNVLYDGRAAKLADLGQAKVFGPGGANSRNTQTAMPGAMVYAAPEVLTGKYSARVDVFSFGVLLAQLATGEHPRIERRQHQVDAAARRFPAARNLLHRCLSLHPDMRPAAAELQRALAALKADPATGYAPAPHGAGLVAARRFREGLRDARREAEMRAVVMEKRLEAELGRWHAEADARSAVEKKLAEAEANLKEAFAAIEAEKKKAQDAQDREAAAVAARQEAEEQVDKIYASLQSTKKEAEDLTAKLQREVKSTEAAARLRACAEQNEARAVAAAERAEAARAAAEAAAEAAREELEAARAHGAEAEERVSQLLARWEREKVERLALRARTLEQLKEIKTLKAGHDEAVQAAEAQRARLAEYAGLAPGDRVKAALRDADADRSKAQKQIQDLKETIQNLEESVSDCQNQLEEQIKELQELNVNSEQMRENLESIQKVNSELEESMASMKLQAEKDLRQEGIKVLRLQDEKDILQAELNEMKEEAPWLFKKRGASSERSKKQAADEEEHQDQPPGSSRNSVAELPKLKDPKRAIASALEEGGLESVAALLRTRPTEADLQWRGVRALREAAFRGDAERARLGGLGAPQIVVHAMNNHPDHQMLQSNAVRCLSNLAFGSDENRIDIGRKGGISSILEAMQRFSGDSSIQGQGCTALTNLSHNCERNRNTVCSEDGVAVILDAMHNYPGDAKLQRQACWALLTLAGSEDGCHRIASGGGVDAILGALERHQGDAAVAHFGCWALANVAWGREDVQESVRQAGAPEIVRAALARHAGDRGVMEKAQLALDTLRCMF